MPARLLETTCRTSSRSLSSSVPAAKPRIFASISASTAYVALEPFQEPKQGPELIFFIHVQIFRAVSKAIENRNRFRRTKPYTIIPSNLQERIKQPKVPKQAPFNGRFGLLKVAANRSRVAAKHSGETLLL